MLNVWNSINSFCTHWFSRNLKISARFSWQVSSQGFVTVCSVPRQELAFSALLKAVFIFFNYNLKYDITFTMSFFLPRMKLLAVSSYHLETASLNTFSSAALVPWNHSVSIAISLCFYTLTKLPQGAMTGPLPLLLLPNVRNIHRALLCSQLLS